ncbi:YcbK family protein [Candidatus Margulisiibacteriota bacterium]
MFRKWLIWLVILIIFGLPSAMTQEDLLQKDGYLSLYNTHNHETLKIKYVDNTGDIDPLALDAISYHLRCPYTQRTLELDPELLVLMDQIQDFFGKEKTIRVISGFRSPFYNSKLRVRSEGVAKYSYHMQGKAADIEIEGIDLQDIHTYAKLLHQGGVGLYANRFVHVDVGPIRFW